MFGRSMLKDRRLLLTLIGLVAAETVVGLGGYWSDLESDPGLLAWASFGWAFVFAGMAAWQRRPENRTGPLMISIGFLRFLPRLAVMEHPATWTIGALLRWAWVIPFAYLLLSFPRGYLETLFERAFVAITAAAMVFPQGIGMLFEDSTPPGLNLLFVKQSSGTAQAAMQISSVLDFSLLVVLVAALISRWRTASAPARRVLTPVFVAGLGSIAFLAVAMDLGHFIQDASILRGMQLLVPGVMWGLPFAFLYGLLRARSRRAMVSQLVVELGKLPAPEGFQSALSRTLGDPSLKVGFWSEEEQAYLGAQGAPLIVPEGHHENVTTYLQGRQGPLAAIVHDQALLDDPRLVDAVAAAARLAVENDRLYEQVERQLQEVSESRARIVQAADEERRRVERDLHDGAQQRLVSLSLALRSAQSLLSEESDPEAKMALQRATKELEEAIREIRELARGIHPSILTDEGLGPALEALAERSKIPMTLEGLPQERLPGPVEAAGYFVVAEAHANAVKHAGASGLHVRAKRTDGRLILEVADDGAGGARLESGGGLQGLADRLEALGGELQIQSPDGQGTRIVATLPT